MPSPVPKSPNAAAFDKYGDYQVNLYTGLPDISIPIYEVKSGQLSLPISLSYHASGIRYTDQASWVGLGWSLNGGGQITRSVQGLVDETQGFFENPIDWNIQSNPNCEDFDYIKNTIDNHIDREPDLYSYSFPGGGGKFYRRQNGLAPFLFPYRPLKIEFVSSQIEVTDESGTIYRYGKNSENAYAMEATDNGSYSATTAWYLMEIIAPNSDDKISITYQSAGNAQMGDVSHSIAITHQCNSDDTQELPCPSLSPSHIEKNTYSTISTMGIKEIFFETGKVEFVLGQNRNDLTGLKSLDKINIFSKKNGQYVLQKSFAFKTSYFKNASETQDLRLKLDSLLLLDGEDQLVNKYGFNYHTNKFSWNQPVNSYARDYWGFYNGKTSNTNLIPTTTMQYQANTNVLPVPLTFGGADRSTDTQFLTEGVIKEIHYPTGGYTFFEFEPHRYEENGQAQYVGGLRVRKISSYSATGNVPKVKEYRYGESESGYGVLNFDVRSYFFKNDQLIRSTSGWIQPPIFSEYVSSIYVSNSLLGQGSDESPVVYPIVSEYDGLVESNNGKTVYEFDNKLVSGDPVMTVWYSNKIFKNSKSWARGKLTKKTVFDDSGMPVKQSQISYALLSSDTQYVGQGTNQYIVPTSPSTWFKYYMIECTTDSINYYDGMTYAALNYQQSTGIYKETSSTDIVYYLGAPTLTKTTNVVYDPVFLQVVERLETGSGNPEKVITKTRYPFEIVDVALTYTGKLAVIKQMLQKNILNTPLEQFYIVEENGVQNVIAGQYTVYKSNLSNGNYVVPDSIYFLETDVPVAVSGFVPIEANAGSSNIVKDSRYQPRICFQDYDQSGNIRQVAKLDDATITYLWGYNYTLPIAKIENSTLTEVVSALLPTSIAALQTLDGTTLIETLKDLQEELPQAMVTIFTHDPLSGMTSQTDPNGLTTTFQYDKLGRLETVTDDKGNIVKKLEYHYTTSTN